MEEQVNLLDVVALTRPRRSDEGKYLLRGHVGTVVEVLAKNVFLIELADDFGEAYAFASVAGEDLMVLHHCPVVEPAAG